MRWISRCLLSGLISVLGALFFLSPAYAAFIPLFSADFESSVPQEFSTGSLSSSRIGAEALNQGLSQYLGPFTLSESTTLTLTGLPTPTLLRLEFDLYLFTTWDGSGSSGPDFFSLSGDVTFQETFTNHQGTASNPNQTYDSLGDVFLNSSGTALSGFGDAGATQAFFDLGPTGSSSFFEFVHNSDTFTVTFGGPTSQSDEQWGIDNVRVSIIPEPSSLALLGLGAAVIVIGTYRQRRPN